MGISCGTPLPKFNKIYFADKNNFNLLLKFNIQCYSYIKFYILITRKIRIKRKKIDISSDVMEKNINYKNLL